MTTGDVDLAYLLDCRVKIREKETGIYFLFDAEEVVYVGQSYDIDARIRTHVSEGKKSFSSYSRVVISGAITWQELNELEAYFICKFHPKYNSVLPAQNRYLTLTTFLERSDFNRMKQVTQDLCRELRTQKKFWDISELDLIFSSANIPKNTYHNGNRIY